MRRTELVVAVAMALVSVSLMWKSAELPVGWIPDEGPGGGAFPFWLSAGMLACSLWIMLRWVRGTSPVSRAAGPFMHPETRALLLTVVVALTAMVASIHVIGVYGAIPLFLLFYMRYIGRHSWWLTGSLAVLTPIVTFFFFDVALKITLPKGRLEPLFYPLYDLFL